MWLWVIHFTPRKTLMWINHSPSWSNELIIPCTLRLSRTQDSSVVVSWFSRHFFFYSYLLLTADGMSNIYTPSIDSSVRCSMWNGIILKWADILSEEYAVNLLLWTPFFTLFTYNCLNISMWFLSLFLLPPLSSPHPVQLLLFLVRGLKQKLFLTISIDCDCISSLYESTYMQLSDG